jgi:ubiquinone/menaquinone biosynthesis C-methylase UbiE
MPQTRQKGIMQRYATRAQAERYRDRFRTGRRLRTHEKEIAAIGEALKGLGRVETILDLGCGPGRFVPPLAAAASRLVQIDYSEHMLDVNRRDHPLPPDRSGYIQADAKNLPLADGSIDVALCHRVLNHFPEPAARTRILSELARVASQGVVISCLAPPWPLRPIRRFYARLRRRTSVDGNVEERDLLDEAKEAGLTLAGRVRIRRFPFTGDFLTLRPHPRPAAVAPVAVLHPSLTPLKKRAGVGALATT